MVKILDWGKYNYEQGKQLQKSKRHQKNIEVKQIRLGLKTDAHDIEVKLKAAHKFLEFGHKVKINLRFKGREITHPELGQKVLSQFFDKIKDVAEMEIAPSMTGKELSIVIVRKKNAKTQDK